VKFFALAATFLICAPLLAETHIVKVGDYYFQDQTTLTNVSRIRRGDVVRWEWVNGFHTTTEVAGLWDAPIEPGAQSYQRTFRKPGRWNYVCTRHPKVMRGSVIVDGDQTFVSPISMSVSPGIIISGGNNEIRKSDDERLILQPGPSFLDRRLADYRPRFGSRASGHGRLRSHPKS
jgi:hypothetical protein